jgi:hypothetical protein
MACDPNFGNVAILISCDGTNGSTSFPDSGPNNLTVTPVNGADVSTTNPKFGTGCLNADTDNRLDVAITPSGPMDFAPGGDWTIEFWVRFDSTGFGTQVMVDYGGRTLFTGIAIQETGGDATAQPDFGGGFGWSAVAYPGAFIAGSTYYHVAVVKSGDNGQIYINGVGGPSPATNWTGAPAGWGTTASFGASYTVFGIGVFGAMDEIRVSNFARYTADFTAPTEAFGTEQCVEPTTVPDVVGETLEDATTEIEAALLVVGVTTTAHSDTIPAGSVISQDPIGGTSAFSGDAVNLVLSTGPLICSSIPFEGYIAWPYLDFGLLGIDKMLEGFDAVIDGTFRVSFGYSQRDFSLATPDYALDGDTLDGGMVPMPLTAPSFQLRITFDASQAWEWFASNLYINNEGTG